MIKNFFLGMFVFLFILTTKGLAGQAIDPDSLDHLIAETTDADEKINLLIKTSEYFAWKDINKAEVYTRQLLEYSEEQQNDKGRAYGYLFLARIFAEFDYELAEEFMMKSEDFARKINDQDLQGKLYNTKGILKNKAGLYNEEIDYYFKALKIYETTGNDSLKAGLYNNLGIAYSDEGEKLRSAEYYRQAADINAKLKNWLWLSINLMNIGFEYAEMGKVDTALEYLQRSLNMAKEHDYRRLLPWIYNSLGYTYLTANNTEKAEGYYLLAVEYAVLMNNREQQIEGLTKLQDIYENRNDIEKAYRALIQIQIESDSLRQLNWLSKIDQLKLAHKYEKELEMADLKYKNQRLFFWYVIIGLVFVISIIIVLFYFQRLKAKRDKAISEKLVLEKGYLEKEMEIKSRELIAKVMHLNSVNELINEVVNKLSSSDFRFKEENIKPVNEIISSLKMNMRSNILEGFDTEFTQVHPSFFDKLSNDYPELTSNEKRLCAFLRLNMNTKEISEISHLEMSSVEKARTRLRRKLKLTGRDLKLSQFLQHY